MAHDLGLNVVSIDLESRVGSDLRLPMAEPAELSTPPRSSTACRWLYFSSGTTGEPKGARHSDESVMASARGMNERLGFTDGDVYPIAFPIAHIGGMTMLTAALVGGGRLVLFDSWDPATTPGRAALHRPTILGSAQPFFRAYLDAQRRRGDEPLFPALRICAAGGAPTPAELIHELVEVFGVPGVVNSWGLTEFPVATCSKPDDSPRILAETVGRACPGVSIRLINDELRLKGGQCFLGYVDPAGDVGAFDDEGWFCTGDLGEIDRDGNVRVTGRLKDIIIRNAENISALELEDILLRHPGIADVAVIGLPDGRTGERVCAVVVPEREGTCTLAELAEQCRVEGVAPQKWPEQLEHVDVLPRNAMGKILKQQLKDRFG
jgi:acyl-CoA synthetase (AMP-forming)/AMP-acid ligase II